MKPLIRNISTPFITSALILVLATAVASQNNAFHFNHFGIEDGLSQTSVTSIVQDDKGFMWFGTVGGLNRYDGHDMVIYRSDLIDNNSLSDKQITDMCKDPEDNLWISTINGVSYFNPKTEEFRRYYKEDGANSISDNAANSVYCDTDGTVWVATDQGLDKLTNPEEGFAHFLIEGGENNFQEVYRDKEGTLWAGSFGEGLYYLEPEKDQLEISRFSALHDQVINEIYEDSEGYLWVGTDEGLFRIHRESEQVTAYQHKSNNSASLSNNTVNVLYQDSQSNFWIGTENGLNLYQPDKDEFIRFQADPRDEESINSDRVHSIYEDNHNTLWIGTWSNGISKFSYHQKGIRHYSHQPEYDHSLSNNNIWDFAEDEDNYIWIGTDMGLNRFDKETKQFTHFLHDPNDESSISNNRIFNIEQDRSGNLWMTTMDGLNRFNPRNGKSKRYLHVPGDNQALSYNTLWGLDIDASGNVWVATTGRGLNVLDPETETFRHYNHDPDDPESLSASFITDIFIDSKNQVWVGTRRGLNLYQSETDTFKKFPHNRKRPHSLGNSTVMDMHEDSNGHLWVGTAMGVNILDTESHEVLNFLSNKDGLPDDTAWGVTEDHYGTIYIGTTLGLAVWNTDTETFNIYDKKDGLQDNEFNAGAAFTSSTGEVYVGGINGFNSFYPSDLTGNPNVPPVVITDFQLFNESVPIGGSHEENKEEQRNLKRSITYTDKLTLSHADNVISFEFAALNFTIPEKNQYAYKLDGFDEKWNYIGDRNFVTYTELPPGEYIFRVKASNNDGLWNEDGTSLALVITPPAWQTSWFYTLSILFIIGVIFTSYRLRVRNIKEYSKRLEKDVTDRTNELNKKNRDLELTLKELQTTKDELVENAHKAGMADIATGVLHNVGNILNSVNTSASLIEDTVKQSKLAKLGQANEILSENISQIEEFIAGDTKGKKLLEYYLALDGPLKNEQADILYQLKRLIDKINLINEVISAQQNYVGASTQADQTSLQEMIDNALGLQAGSIEKHGLVIEKDLQATAPVIAQRSKLIHVLVNLFKNAKEAMNSNHTEEKKITVKTWQDEKNVFLSITDNGTGVKKENLNKIFSHGFTTKKSGHGFGLHSCANYMTEMGGKIEVHSEGEGKGTTFNLSFPIASDKTIHSILVQEKNS